MIHHSENAIRLKVCGFYPGTFYVVQHVHQAVEILYILEGEPKTQIGREVYVMHPGELFLIPAGIRHNQFGFARNIYLNFYLPPEEQPRIGGVDCSNDVFIDEWVRSLYRLAKDSLPDEAHFLTGAIYTRFCQLREESHSDLPLPLQKAQLFIGEHFAEPMTTTKIAEAAGVSANYLNSLFQKYLGMSCVEHLIRHRLHAAEYLLKNPYLSLDEIAERCGFNSTNYFIRAFHRVLGVTPGKLHRAD